MSINNFNEYYHRQFPNVEAGVLYTSGLGLAVGLEGHRIGLGLVAHIRLVAGDTRVFEVH